jgi:hypothetical protein
MGVLNDGVDFMDALRSSKLVLHWSSPCIIALVKLLLAI